VPEHSMVSIGLYDVKGQLLETIVPPKMMDKGIYNFRVLSLNSRPGMYYIKLRAGTKIVTKRFLYSG